MGKVEFIKKLSTQEFIWERASLIRALINSLTSRIACQLFDVLFIQDHWLQNIIFNKICNDMNFQFHSFHRNLIDKISANFDALPYQKKQSAAFYLREFYNYSPEEVKKNIASILVSSRYLVIRRFSYQIISNNWTKYNEKLIINSWRKYRDVEAAEISVRKLPIKFIQKEFDILEEILVANSFSKLAKLYIRVGKTDKKKLERLKQIDEITYLYTLVKLDKKINNRTAWQIFEKNIDKERAGLMLWCFGRMGLWDVLIDICKRKINKKVFSQIYT